MSASLHFTSTVKIEDDHELVQEFLKFQLQKNILPLAGTSSCGLGSYFGTFDGMDHRELFEFFNERR